MPSLTEALAERAGPFPVWLWAAAAGGALYLFAHRVGAAARAGNPSTVTTQGNPTFSPFAGGWGALFGSPAALTGPPLQPNPTPVTPTSQQAGAATIGTAAYIPTPIPPVGGGDNAFVGGYVGLPRQSKYDIARGGAS